MKGMELVWINLLPPFDYPLGAAILLKIFSNYTAGLN